MEFQAAAGRAGYLDQQVRGIGRQRVPGQSRLGDVDGPVHHFETAQPGHLGFVDGVVGGRFVAGIGVLRAGGPEPAQYRPRGGRVEQRRGAAQHPVEPFARGLRFRLGFFPALAARQADRDGEVGVDGRDRRHRQRIEDAAVGQQSSVDGVRRDDSRDCDGRPDRLVDRSALQPHRFAGQQIGGHRGVGDRQFLDGRLAKDVAHRVQDLFGAQHTGGRQRRVQQPQNCPLRQRPCPVREFVQSVGGLQSAYECAHRRARDADDLVTTGVQFIDHPDVGVPAGTAAAKRQRHPGPGYVEQPGSQVGVDVGVGHAYIFACAAPV